MIYFRPLLQSDPCRPSGAVALRGGPLWFDQMEPMERGVRHALMPVGEAPTAMLDRFAAPHTALLSLPQDRPALMGVLNVTPDSFSDGGQHDTPERAVARARAMVAEGADILDIGGESTRPGAEPVSAADEIARVVPVIEALRAAGVSTLISVDTRKAAVAQAALAAGADMLNDVSAMTYDPDMAAVAADAGVPICLMHAQGDPATMQEAPHYDNVLLDVYDHLSGRLEAAVAAGIDRARVVLDPGIGFGKSQAHNLALLKGLGLFHMLGCTLLLGVSRKRFIGNIGGAERAEDRAPGSLAVALAGVAQGVQIIRAHDIEAHAQAFALWRAVQG